MKSDHGPREPLDYHRLAGRSDGAGPVQHLAGPLGEDGVQRCVRCGGIILDYREALVCGGDERLFGFTEGPVVVDRGRTITGTELGAVLCGMGTN